MPERTGREQGVPGAEPGGRVLGVPGRSEGGRFVAGASGNPRGRPKGSRDKRTLLLSELLDGGGAEIVAKLVKLAKAGKPWAVRLAVERIVPRLERRLEIELPRIERAEDIAAAVATVIECAADGSLTLEEAGGFLELIEAQRKVIETADLAVRLELLEEAAAEAKAAAKPRRGGR
jgi:uncharacterized protein DUF5681